jgi:thiamine pyrophosphokinase
MLDEGDGVSVFAIGAEAFGVSIKGLSYEADNITLSPSMPLGVSNYSIGKTAYIGVTQGALLIMLRKMQKNG